MSSWIVFLLLLLSFFTLFSLYVSDFISLPLSLFFGSSLSFTLSLTLSLRDSRFLSCRLECHPFLNHGHCYGEDSNQSTQVHAIACQVHVCMLQTSSRALNSPLADSQIGNPWMIQVLRHVQQETLRQQGRCSSVQRKRKSCCLGEVHDHRVCLVGTEAVVHSRGQSQPRAWVGHWFL